MASRIESYGVIGDCETAALVSLDGSIDWLCWPRFDSAPCFAALLGSAANGHWRLAPIEPSTSISRRYVEDTLVLETDHLTPTGCVKVTDFMPLRGQASDLVRIVTGESGRVRLSSEIVFRFDGGRIKPLITRTPEGLCATTGPHAVRIASDVEQWTIREGRCTAQFEVCAGQRLAFVLTYFESFRPVPEAVDGLAALERTVRAWRDWMQGCGYEGPWRTEVGRSLITLKALTYGPTGGMVAAPTSSLPESLGGPRNWDYRYCWLRDATFTLMSLLEAGYVEEAAAWRDWLIRSAAGDVDRLQPIYTVLGEHRLTEWEADWLKGYEESRPVRFGNDAARQRQLDILGEVVDVLYQAERHGVRMSPVEWGLLRALIGRIEQTWREPDRGIWEVRGSPQRFTHSMVLAWAGADRGVRLACERGATEDAVKWSKLRDSIHAEVCSSCYDTDQGCFTQAAGVKALDAATLLMPLVGFLPACDPRIQRTVDAIRGRLMRDGFVRRYDPDATDDGLRHGEAPFLACTFWYADNLALQERFAEAEAVFTRLLSVGNDLGLFSEEYDPGAGRALGNFPQALTHVSLIGTAFNLTGRGPAHRRSNMV